MTTMTTMMTTALNYPLLQIKIDGSPIHPLAQRSQPSKTWNFDEVTQGSHPSSRPSKRLIQVESDQADREAARLEAQRRRHESLQAHRREMELIKEEIAPRAEPGTRERRLEKRREAAAANREFANAARGGSPTPALPESELFGGDDDLQALKREREREQRKKNERELRREEILRAKAAEREERLRRYREREEETIGWLKALAKQRFG